MSRIRWPRVLFVAVLVAFPAAFALADPPKAIVKPIPAVEPSELVQIDASDSVGDSLQFLALDGKAIFQPPGTKLAYLNRTAPGSYSFLLVVAGVDNGKAQIATAPFTVQVNGSKPDPPNIDPVKPAPPAPSPAPLIAGDLHATLVYDRDALSQDLAAVCDDPAIPLAMKPLKAHFHLLATGTAEFDRSNLAAYVLKAGGPPCLILQTQEGKVLPTPPAPKSTADVLAAVRNLRPSLWHPTLEGSK